MINNSDLEKEEEDWDLIIKPHVSAFSFNLKEIWFFRDLLGSFIKREIVMFYKQTILGPLWFFIQPLLTSIVFIIVFSKIAHIPTDNKPPVLFYLAGNIIWTFFADALNNTATTFTSNAAIYSKVYFPRIITPLAKVISNLLKFAIQLLLFFIIYAYLVISGFASFQLQWSVFLLPIVVIIMMLLGLGLGLIITAMTTKYKDLIFLITFGVQLLMYSTPIIYSLNSLKGSKYYNLIAFNPLTPAIETFKASTLGGDVNLAMLLYGFGISLLIFFIGLVIFNKSEKNFIDTI